MDETNLAGWADLLAWADALPGYSLWLRYHLIFLHPIPMQLPVPIGQVIPWDPIPATTGRPIASHTLEVLPFILGRLEGMVVVGFWGDGGGGGARGESQAQHLGSAVEDVWVGLLQVGQIDQGLADLGPLLQLALEAAKGLDTKGVHLVVSDLAQLVQYKAQEQSDQWPSQ